MVIVPKHDVALLVDSTIGHFSNTWHCKSGLMSAHKKGDIMLWDKSPYRLGLFDPTPPVQVVHRVQWPLPWREVWGSDLVVLQNLAEPIWLRYINE